ncbi:MAG: radical SAM protein [Candidatus Micrarchaeota archaeon]|nr:radical SAM protein [Candidatus Micrarchaeota archaeon]
MAKRNSLIGCEKMKNAIWKEMPLVYSGLPTKTSVSLYENGIAFEPRGSPVHKMFMGLAKGVYHKEMKEQFAMLKEWQKRKMIEIYRIMKRRKEKIINFDARLEELRKMALDEEISAGTQKLPISAIAITERCNRHCLHCAVLSDMSLGQMPFKDLEHYLGLISVRKHLSITYGEPFVYNSDGKDLGDAVKLILERFPHALIYIITSGIRTQTEMSAAEKIAGLGDFDKSRIRISISARSFTHDIKIAGRTLRFFIENGISAVPRFEGISLMPCKDGKWRKSIQNRKVMLADILAEFGIMREDSMKFPSNVYYRGGLWCMGNAVKNHGIISSRMNEYFKGRKEDGNSYCMMTSWDCNRGVSNCSDGEFGLMPDGAVIPSCCTFASNFLRLGSIRNATDENIGEITKQMKEDAKGMIIAGKRGMGNTCKPCVSWFREKGKGNRIGIRDAERFRRAIPAPKDLSKLRRGLTIPANVL